MNGYTPVGVNLASKPAVIHYIFVRKHASKENETAIFVSGLPYDTTVDNIKDLCSGLGSVILDRFEYQGKNRGLIHLTDDASCARFLKKATKPRSLDWAMYGPRGAEGYELRNELRFPDEQTLLDQANVYMEEFAELEAEHKRQVVDAAIEVDADGFQTVVNTKRKQLPGQVSSSSKKAKKNHEKADFYRFQLREHRKQEMNDLLKKFQQDKEKVAELQRKRLLNPY